MSYITRIRRKRSTWISQNPKIFSSHHHHNHRVLPTSQASHKRKNHIPGKRKSQTPKISNQSGRKNKKFSPKSRKTTQKSSFSTTTKEWTTYLKRANHKHPKHTGKSKKKQRKFAQNHAPTTKITTS